MLRQTLCRPRRAGFLLALLTERCLFVDFDVFHSFFTHELDFGWGAHQVTLRLLGSSVLRVLGRIQPCRSMRQCMWQRDAVG